MSIFYLLVFVYITLVGGLDVLSILIYFSLGLILLKILLYIENNFPWSVNIVPDRSLIF